MYSSKKSDIYHIGIFGKTNAGKSTLVNKICNQEVSITSDIKGTTTDPVNKRFELLEVGAVNFIDTAGLDDTTSLGHKRVQKTMEIIKEADLLLLVITSEDKPEEYQKFFTEAKKYHKQVLVICNQRQTETNNYFKDAINLNFFKDIDKLYELLKKYVIIYNSQNIVKQFLNQDDIIVLVCPIDSEAPKGRIIAPQVAVLREQLDNYCISVVIQPEQLKKTLELLPTTRLVVTDSQAFAKVNKLVPKNILLTSFSILMANAKGDIKQFIDGLEYLDKITKDTKILIAESCSHNVSHEDIGKHKIPKLLETHLGFKPNITHKMGKDFPAMIDDFDFIIHCGSCMLKENILIARQLESKRQNIPITNYGLLLAKLHGLNDRGLEIFKDK